MKRAMLAILLILSVATGLQPASVALGSVERPQVSEAVGPQQTTSQVAAAKLSADRKQEKNERRLSSFYARIKQEVLAKFRPVQRDEPIDFDEAQKALSSKTQLEKIFNPDFEKKMRVEYANRVKPHEATATNPIWRARYWEQQRLQDGQKSLASWTAREVLDDQLKEFINGGDSDSAPMKVLETAHELSGGESKSEKSEKLTDEEKIARAHRRDLPPLVAAEEESTPTKLKAKINVIKQQGALVFSNPVAVATVNGSKEDVTANINREFRKLTLRSAVNYGVKNAELNFNVNKKITDEVSVDLDHYAYTGGKKGTSGESSKEQARVNYSISF